jgi:hypothetical protein
MSVTVGDSIYPSDEEIIATVRTHTDDAVEIEELTIVERLGNPRLANTVLLRALSTRLEVSPET